MACSCIKANEKAFGSHHCPKPEIAFSLKNKPTNSYQENISRITVDITKKDNETLGLTVSGGADRGETPVIANIRPGSIAEKSDIFLIGDHIISINGISTSSLCHQEIVSLVKTSKPTITLVIDYELPEKIETQKDVKIKQTNILLSGPEEDESYGLVIRGGFCKDPSKIRPLTVMHIRPGSLAERDGRVKPGDRIISIRNCKVDHLSPENLIALFREQRDQMTFNIEYSVASVDMSAVSGRPIIVEIQKQVNERLGVSIATYHDNSTDSQIFYIENIEAGSVADRCGVLQIGQIITAIQDLRTDKMTIQDAIEALKSGQRERIKLRIIPNLHLDQIKWSQQEKSILTNQQDQSMLQLISAKDLQNLHDDSGNLNTSNTDSLVGSDPLDLQCNCSEIYLSGTGNTNTIGHAAEGSSSLKNLTQIINPPHETSIDLDFYHQHSKSKSSKNQYHNQFSLPYTTRPKSVLGLESAAEMLSLATYNSPANNFHQSQASNYYKDFTGSATNQQKKDYLSKSTNALFPQAKSFSSNQTKKTASFVSGSQESSSLSTTKDINFNNQSQRLIQSHWLDAQVTLTSDSHGTYGLMLTTDLSEPSLCNSSNINTNIRLTKCPRIAGLQPSKPAASSGLIVEGDLLKSVDGLSTIGRTLDHINNQLSSIASNGRGVVNLVTLFEVRRPDDPQLMLENTVFEICLKKQAGSLGINLQALVTRTSGEPLIISKVLPGSAASRCGCIQPGDLLLALDNQPIDKCTLAEAVHLLQSSSDSVTLRIKKGLKTGMAQSDLGVFTVDLRRELPCQPWGIVISGTDDSTDQPILIDSINRASLATGVSRLAPGDQLLSINGHSLRGCTLTQAMALLHQYPDRVRLTVLRQQPGVYDEQYNNPNNNNNNNNNNINNSVTKQNEELDNQNQRYKFNTKSLGRSEIRSRTKTFDNQKFLVSSMTLPPLRNSEATINEPQPVENIWSIDHSSTSRVSIPLSLPSTLATAAPLSAKPATLPPPTTIPSIAPPTAITTTESDSSDSQTTTHSLFAKSHRHYLLRNKEIYSQQPFLSHQSASFESNSSSTSGREKHHFSLSHHHHQHQHHQNQPTQTPSASSSNSLLYLKNSTSNPANRNKEFSITEESATVIEGSEVDSSQADILESIQCPGCREAIENEWRSKEKLNEAWNNDRRTARVHGGAVPMTVNLPTKFKTRSDSTKSTHEQKSDFPTLLDQYSAKRADSEKDISSAGFTKLSTVNLCRKNPTESFGIGVSEGLSPKGTFISAIKPNSPASNCDGLQLYDEIVEVNGLSTENMRCSDVVTLISQSENNLELLIRKRRQIVASATSVTSANNSNNNNQPMNTGSHGTLPYNHQYQHRQQQNHQRNEVRSASLKRPQSTKTNNISNIAISTPSITNLKSSSNNNSNNHSLKSSSFKT